MPDRHGKESDTSGGVNRRTFLKTVGATAAASAAADAAVAATVSPGFTELPDPSPDDSTLGGGRRYYEWDQYDGYTEDEVAGMANGTVVSTASELTAALPGTAGDVIYVREDARIDLSGELDLDVGEGVTLASNRGQNGSLGGLLYYDEFIGDADSSYSAYHSVFETTNSGIRVTGLRFVGPTTEYWVPSDTGNGMDSPPSDNPTQSEGATEGFHFTGTQDASNPQTVEVDNCQFYGWPHTPISSGWYAHSDTDTGATDPEKVQYTDLELHHCAIHNNQMENLGYGLNTFDGNATVSYCYFEKNRHSIAGYGWSENSYEAHHNVVGSSVSHAFDMHRLGQNGRSEGNDGWTAGGTIDIHDNQFRFTESTQADSQWTDRYGAGQEAIGIRGEPANQSFIANNQFAHSGADVPGSESDDPGIDDHGDAYRQETSTGDWVNLARSGDEFAVPLGTDWRDFDQSDAGHVETATTTIDDFEDGDLAEYSVGVSNASVESSAAHEGSYGLTLGRSSYGTVRSDSGLNAYPAPDDAWEFWMNPQTLKQAFSVFFGVQSDGDLSESLRLNFALGDGYVEFEERGTGGDNYLGSAPLALTAGTWYRVVLDGSAGADSWDVRVDGGIDTSPLAEFTTDATQYGEYGRSGIAYYISYEDCVYVDDVARHK